MYPLRSLLSCSDVTPAGFDLRPGKRLLVEDSRQRLLQHRPTLCTYFQRVAAGDATQRVALGRSILISTPRGWYREIFSGIPDFAHTRTSIHPGTGTGGCVRVLLYFSTKREMHLSICTSTAGSGAFPGCSIFAAGAGILQ